MRSHPGRSVSEILQHLLLIRSAKFPSERSDYGLVNVLLPKMPERLDDQAAGPSGGPHGSRSGLLQMDFLVSNPHGARRPIGKKHKLGRHLPGKAQQIRGIGTRRKQPDVVPADQCLRNGIGAWRQRANSGVGFGVVVKPSGQPTNGAC